MSAKMRRRASVVCLHDGCILVVKLQDPTSKEILYCMPGGEIDTDELPSQAAIRETLEETGLSIRIDTDSHYLQNNYVFHWDGKDVKCSTDWFYAEVDGDTELRPVKDVEYNLGSIWLQIANIDKAFDYHPQIKKIIFNYIHKYSK